MVAPCLHTRICLSVCGVIGGSRAFVSFGEAGYERPNNGYCGARLSVEVRKRAASERGGPIAQLVGRSELARFEQLAGALQGREQGTLVALVAVELRLLGLLLGTTVLFAAEAEIAIEAKL